MEKDAAANIEAEGTIHQIGTTNPATLHDGPTANLIRGSEAHLHEDGGELVAALALRRRERSFRLAARRVIRREESTKERLVIHRPRKKKRGARRMCACAEAREN
jgi:hypothetical protein